MKKLIALLLTLALTLSYGVLSATAEQGAGLKLGLYINTTLSNSTDASDTDGLAQVGHRRVCRSGRRGRKNC